MKRRNVEPRRRSITRLCAPAVYLVVLLCSVGSRSAKAQPIVLALGSGIGLPGGTASVTVSMSGDTGRAVGAGLLVLFPAGTQGALTITPQTDCTLAPRLVGNHVLAALPLTLPPGGQGFDL